MNSNNNNAKDEYKECACSGCSKNGTNYLRIMFLCKDGWFCETCAAHLIGLGLIDQEGMKSN